MANLSGILGFLRNKGRGPHGDVLDPISIFLKIKSINKKK